MESQQGDRIIILLDADCFEIQVYQNLDPGSGNSLGKPCVVTNSSGRITAVNYEAKPYGISRDDGTFQKAKLKCSALVNVKIPEKLDHPGHPDYTIQREATNLIVNELKRFCEEQSVAVPTFQNSSRDEFYVDVTKFVQALVQANGTRFPSSLAHQFWPKSIVETEHGPMYAGNWRSTKLSEIKFFYGLAIASQLVQRLKDKTGFQTSAGVGGNKLIAKLACGLNKPAAATLILPTAITQVGQKIKIGDVPGLGGRLGEAIKASLDTKYMNDLASFKVEDIANISANGSGLIGQKKAQDFYNRVHGICNEKVVEKDGPASIMASVQLYGSKYVFTQLMDEIRSLTKTILQRVEVESKWRHRVPISLKLTVKRRGQQTLSGRLEYPVDTQNADEILDMFLEQMKFDDWWDEIGEPLTTLELQAQPFGPIE